MIDDVEVMLMDWAISDRTTEYAALCTFIHGKRKQKRTVVLLPVTRTTKPDDVAMLSAELRPTRKAMLGEVSIVRIPFGYVGAG